MVICTSFMYYMHYTGVTVPLEGPTGRKFELYPPLTPTQTIPQGIDGGGIPKREAVSQS